MDPDVMRLQFQIDETATGARQDLFLEIGVGTTRGFLACLEPAASRLVTDCADPLLPWETWALRGPTTWTPEEVPDALGLVYRSASSSTYPNDADMVLVSPPFNLAAHSTLQLLHEWDTEDLGGGYCMDGGFVEIAVSGGAWEPLVPEGGAPRKLFGYSVPALAETPVFGGKGTRRWDRFALGERQGTAHLRFRFVSGDSIRAPGWSVLRVEVSAGVPVEPDGRSVRVAIEPNPMRFPGEVRFRIEAPHSQPALQATLRVLDVRGRLVRVLTHPGVPSQTARFLWDGTDRAGVPVASGIYWAQVQWGTQRAQSKLIVVH